MQSPTVTELIVEGFDAGGFCAEHALACAMADASPKLKDACKNAIQFLNSLPSSIARDGLLVELAQAVDLATTPATKVAS
jgi:hypothetical protein